jgi:fermentation-respiration switch protein FrsA (DUF1100 family)
MLVMHGDDDAIVPIALSERLYGLQENRPKRRLPRVARTT